MRGTGVTVVLGVLIVVAVALGVWVLLLEGPDRVRQFRRTRRWSVIGLGASCAAVVVLSAIQGDSSLSVPKVAPPSSAKAASLPTVLRLVAVSDKIQTVPADLMPPVSVALTDPSSNYGGPVAQ
ncbi:MAG TPA: hypothetical protein VNG12_20495, partial [Acidimicrobiales bacterium]|nr:hypothetical protein [Acidimicrobiales bacterium]